MKYQWASRIVLALVFVATLLGLDARAATTLLPNGMQCFATVNGALSSGSIYMYQPGTFIFKQTWQDPNQTVANPQPIPLDANGCATIYGAGLYRQVLFDSSTVQVWDKLTTDTSAFNSTFWAALSSGTPNAITVTYAGFNGTDGTIINFVALMTNTGATTINPSGYGNISVVKDTTGGPVPLVGGEIIASNIVTVLYYSTSNTFHLINPPIQSASGSTSPLCGASNLVIKNDASVPNTIINMTAAQLVTQSTIGIVINRSSINLSAINISTGTGTSTANGMDGEAVGVSRWLYIYAIDNGATAAGLVSSSPTSPTMPSGYSYRCLMGSMPVDGSGNLMRVRQNGKRAQYVVTQGSNTTAMCLAAAGIQGSTYNGVSPTGAAITVAGDGFCMPPYAESGIYTLTNNFRGTGVTSALLAPSTSWFFTNSGPQGTVGTGWPAWLPSTTGALTSTVEMGLEGTTVGYAGAGANAAVLVFGWTNPVNAF